MTSDRDRSAIRTLFTHRCVRRGVLLMPSFLLAGAFLAALLCVPLRRSLVDVRVELESPLSGKLELLHVTPLGDVLHSHPMALDHASNARPGEYAFKLTATGGKRAEAEGREIWLSKGAKLAPAPKQIPPGSWHVRGDDLFTDGKSSATLEWRGFLKEPFLSMGLNRWSGIMRLETAEGQREYDLFRSEKGRMDIELTSQSKEQFFELTALGRRGPASKGNEVWLVNFPQVERAIQEPPGSWTRVGKDLVCYGQKPATLRWRGQLDPPAITLGRHGWSGLARLKTPGGVRELDLCGKNTLNINLTAPLPDANNSVECGFELRAMGGKDPASKGCEVWLLDFPFVDQVQQSPPGAWRREGAHLAYTGSAPAVLRWNGKMSGAAAEKPRITLGMSDRAGIATVKIAGDEKKINLYQPAPQFLELPIPSSASQRFIGRVPRASLGSLAIGTRDGIPPKIRGIHIATGRSIAVDASDLQLLGSGGIQIQNGASSNDARGIMVLPPLAIVERGGWVSFLTLTLCIALSLAAMWFCFHLVRHGVPAVVGLFRDRPRLGVSMAIFIVSLLLASIGQAFWYFSSVDVEVDLDGSFRGSLEFVHGPDSAKAESRFPAIRVPDRQIANNQYWFELKTAGRRNRESQGAEVWLRLTDDLARNIEMLPAGSWKVKEGYLTTPGTAATTLRWHGPMKDPNLVLGSNPWSGLVSLKTPAGEREVDLYRPPTGDRVAIPLKKKYEGEDVFFELTATGQKNPAAKGSEVWLAGFPHAGQVEQDPPGSWVKKGGDWVSSGKQPATLRWHGRLNPPLLKLGRNPWSGIARLKTPQGISDLDLCNSGLLTVNLTNPAGKDNLEPVSFELTATGEKDPDAKGAEVWLLNFPFIDQVSQDPPASWDRVGQNLIFRGGSPATIRWSGSVPRDSEFPLELGVNEWAGKVSVKTFAGRQSLNLFGTKDGDRKIALPPTLLRYRARVPRKALGGLQLRFDNEAPIIKRVTQKTTIQTQYLAPEMAATESPERVIKNCMFTPQGNTVPLPTASSVLRETPFMVLWRTAAFMILLGLGCLLVSCVKKPLKAAVRSVMTPLLLPWRVSKKARAVLAVNAVLALMASLYLASKLGDSPVDIALDLAAELQKPPVLVAGDRDDKSAERIPMKYSTPDYLRSGPFGFEVTATGTKSPLSKGTEVWLKMPDPLMKQLRQAPNQSWDDKKGYWIYNDSKKRPATLLWRGEVEGGLSFSMGKNSLSGIAEVTASKYEKDYDLFTNRDDEVQNIMLVPPLSVHRYWASIPRRALRSLHIELPDNSIQPQIKRLYIGSLIPRVFYAEQSPNMNQWGKVTEYWQPRLEGNAIQLSSLPWLDQGGWVTGFVLFLILTTLLNGVTLAGVKMTRCLRIIWHGPRQEIELGPFRWTSFLAFWLPNLLIWGFVLLCVYPAIMSTSDIMDQWGQIQKLEFNDHHPFFHTILIYNLLKLWNSPALISLVQIITFSAAVAYGCHLLQRARIPMLVVIILYLLCVLSPRNALMATHILKDVPYTIAILWASVLLVSQWLQPRKPKLLACIGFGILLASIPLFRHNGLAIWGLVLPMIFWLYRPWLGRGVLIVCASLFFYAAIKGPVFSSFNVGKVDTGLFLEGKHLWKISSLLDQDVPMKTEELAFLGNVRPLNDRWGGRWGWRYNTRESRGIVWPENGLKLDIKYFHAHRDQFLALNNSLNIRYPLLYLRHELSVRSYIYSLIARRDAIPDTLYVRINQNQFGLKMDPLFPNIKEYLSRFVVWGYTTPWGYGIFWQTAFHLWVSLVATAFVIWRLRDPRAIILIIPSLANTITLFAVSAPQCVRYQYPVSVLAFLPLGLLFLAEVWWRDDTTAQKKNVFGNEGALASKKWIE